MCNGKSSFVRYRFSFVIYTIQSEEQPKYFVIFLFIFQLKGKQEKLLLMVSSNIILFNISKITLNEDHLGEQGKIRASDWGVTLQNNTGMSVS